MSYESNGISIASAAVSDARKSMQMLLAPNRTKPVAVDSWNIIERSSTSFSKSSDLRTNSRPSTVNVTPRPWRAKSSCPTASSSSRTRADTAGCVVCRRSAAAVKLPNFAIQQTMRRFVNDNDFKG